MEAMLESLRAAGTLEKAAALGAAGMSGVFFTLFLFYVLIAIMEKLSKK